MTGVLVRRAEVGGSVVDVRTDGRSVLEIGGSLRARGEIVLDAEGCALIPGLHDHHLHLLALAASLTSLDLSAVTTRHGIDHALRCAAAADDSGWIRAVGYHERPDDKPLDRWALDASVSDRPVRVQHRGGALWILNSAALRLVEHTLGRSADVERDATGTPTGRLFRLDDRLREQLPGAEPDLEPVGRRLRAFGITRVTDATPSLDDGAVDRLRTAAERGAIPRHVVLLGARDGLAEAKLTTGPAKLLLPDHVPLDYDDLCARIRAHHDRGRAVAIHCVTRESMVATVVALEEVGPRAGDRIEHAFVTATELYPRLRSLGVGVTVQPDLLRTRGDDYLREVASDDLRDFHPYASLLRAGVPVCPSSDAPFGGLDPWQVMTTAQSRRTERGRRVNLPEAVTADVVLDGYLRTRPGGPARRVAVGQPGDLVLLDAPLATVLAAPTSERVREVLPTC